MSFSPAQRAELVRLGEQALATFARIRGEAPRPRVAPMHHVAYALQRKEADDARRAREATDRVARTRRARGSPLD